VSADLRRLPPIFTQVLQALQLPDPAPRHVVDTVVGAVARRLSRVPEAEIEVTLRGLQSLGLVALPYLDAAVSPRVTAEPREWITEEGLEALNAARRRARREIDG